VSRCAERLESLDVQARGLKLYRSPLGSYIQDTRSITWKTGTEPENDREGFLKITSKLKNDREGFLNTTWTP